METEGRTIAVMAVATDTALFTEVERHALRALHQRYNEDGGLLGARELAAPACPALASARKPDDVLASAESH
ncbi:MAG: hypothetical protein M3Y74_13120 [Chloroflexota bacterium]|nr:hypothetical protein [Chloroflexota bacterium]